MSQTKASSAFTLVELLVVIGIIAILTTLATAAVGVAMDSARKTREIAAARQLTTAYLLASSEQGKLLPGYQFGAETTFPNGDTGSGPEAERYPWRLAPLLNNAVDGIYMINDAKKAVAGLDPDTTQFRYNVSLAPALGLNAYCVGGYQTSSGTLAANDVATTLLQISRPSSTIAFVSARTKTSASTNSADFAGSFYVRPPGMSPVWKKTSFQETQPSTNWGNVHPRYDGKAVVTFLDGHGSMLSIDELRDMKLWAKNADTADYTFRP